MANTAAQWKKCVEYMRAQIGKGGSTFLKQFYGTLMWTEWCTVFRWCVSQNCEGDDAYGKTDNCGIAALYCQKVGMLENPEKNPNHVYVGDAITYCYSDDRSECTPGYRSHDHIERVTKVYYDSNGNVKGVDSIGGNTGSDSCTTSTVKEHYWDKSYFAGYLHSPLTQKNLKYKSYVCQFRKTHVTSKQNRKGQVDVIEIHMNGLRGGKGYKGKDGKPFAVNGIYSSREYYGVVDFMKAHPKACGKADGIIDGPVWNQMLSGDGYTENGYKVTVILRELFKGNPYNRVGQVNSWQIMLNGINGGKGYRDQNGNKLEVDGDFGDKTEYATMQFQKAHGLPQTGKADEKTLEQMYSLDAISLV